MLGLYQSYLGQGDFTAEVSVVVFPENSRHISTSEDITIFPIYEFSPINSTHVSTSEELTISFIPQYYPEASRHQVTSDSPSLVTVTFIVPEHSRHQLGSAEVELSLESRVFSGVQWVNKIQ